MPRAFHACFVALLGLLPSSPAALAAPPAVSFEAHSVAASGVTPRGKVVWFSIAREIDRQSARIVPRIELATDDDGDGEVRFDLAREVPARSIWFAVDLATGEAGVATPDELGLQEVELPARAIPAALNRLDLDRRFVYIVLVRPGVGAWTLRVGDGGAADDDGQPDGNLRAALARLEGIGPSPLPPPARVLPRDLVLIIDPNRMDFMRFQVRG